MRNCSCATGILWPRIEFFEIRSSGRLRLTDAKRPGAWVLSSFVFLDAMGPPERTGLLESGA